MHKRKDDLLLLVIVTLFWFAQYIFVPFLSPHLTALGITASFAGVIMGSYGIAQLILRIPISVTEDVSGRHKTFILAGLGVLALATVIPLLSAAPAAYLISRVLTGVAASTWVSYTAAFTQNAEDVKARMGRLIAANNLGVMLSYVASAVLFQHVGMNGLFAVSTGSSLLAAVLTLGWKPEEMRLTKRFEPQTLVKVISNRHLLKCAFLTALGQMVVFATSSSFVSNFAKDMGADSVMLSVIAAAFNALGVVTSWLYARGALKKLSERGQLMLAFLLLGIYCALLPLCAAPWQIALVQLVGGAARAIMYTLLMAIAPREIPAEAKTTANGVFQSVYSLGMTAGPVVMGALIDLSGSYAVSFLLMGGAAMAGVMWALLCFGGKKSA
ncbi:MAG: MFS transporter [Clostridia bacterium]|nr:MFS transporter [Clostridia bacterium]